jgi:hypothetical protein
MSKPTSVRRELAIYDGRVRIGSIVQTSKCCQAFGPTGKRIGKFKTRKLALAALDAPPAIPSTRSSPSRRQPHLNPDDIEVMATTTDAERTP